MNDLLLLAMMLPGPKYGYQLKREAGWMMGQDLHNNIVYPMLRRFLDEAWVSKKSVPGERGQTRHQYALTAEGKRTFLERIHAFSESEAVSAEAFYLRVGIFAMLEGQARQRILCAREAFLERRNQRLLDLQAKMDLGKFGCEIIRHMTKQIESEKDWIRHLRRIAKTEKALK